MSHVFPKWFFHQDLLPDGKIIRSQEQFDELGPGWVESPNDFVDREKFNSEEPDCDLDATEKLDAIAEVIEPGLVKKRGRKPKVNP